MATKTSDILTKSERTLVNKIVAQMPDYAQGNVSEDEENKLRDQFDRVVAHATPAQQAEMLRTVEQSWGEEQEKALRASIDDDSEAQDLFAALLADGGENDDDRYGD